MGTLTCDGAADFAFPRADACAVPDHAVLGPLIGLSHHVRLLVDLVIAGLLCCRPKVGENDGVVIY